MSICGTKEKSGLLIKSPRRYFSKCCRLFPPNKVDWKNGTVTQWSSVIRMNAAETFACVKTLHLERNYNNMTNRLECVFHGTTSELTTGWSNESQFRARLIDNCRFVRIILTKLFLFSRTIKSCQVMTKIYDNYLMVKPIQTGLTESHEDTFKKKDTPASFKWCYTQFEIVFARYWCFIYSRKWVIDLNCLWSAQTLF